jgi:hypothetical protein
MAAANGATPLSREKVARSATLVPDWNIIVPTELAR